MGFTAAQLIKVIELYFPIWVGCKHELIDTFIPTYNTFPTFVTTYREFVGIKNAAQTNEGIEDKFDEKEKK